METPTPPPTPEQVLAEAAEELRASVSDALFALKNATPDIPALAGAEEVFRFVYDALLATFPEGLVRQALLMRFVTSHPEPLSFIDINHAKSAIVRINAARRQVEGKPGLILPGSFA